MLFCILTLKQIFDVIINPLADRRKTKIAGQTLLKGVIIFMHVNKNSPDMGLKKFSNILMNTDTQNQPTTPQEWLRIIIPRVDVINNLLYIFSLKKVGDYQMYDLEKAKDTHEGFYGPLKNFENFFLPGNCPEFTFETRMVSNLEQNYIFKLTDEGENFLAYTKKEKWLKININTFFKEGKYNYITTVKVYKSLLEILEDNDPKIVYTMLEKTIDLWKNIAEKKLQVLLKFKELFNVQNLLIDPRTVINKKIKTIVS